LAQLPDVVFIVCFKLDEYHFGVGIHCGGFPKRSHRTPEYHHRPVIAAARKCGRCRRPRKVAPGLGGQVTSVRPEHPTAPPNTVAINVNCGARWLPEREHVHGSLGLISEGVHSSSDFVATLVTWWAVRISNKPADDNHHYGHGKMESMAALFEVGLLLIAAGWISYEATKRLAGEAHPIGAAPVAIGVLVISIVVDFWRVRALRKVARATGSPALEADALHFLSDMLASGVVLIGIVFVALDYFWADAVAALIVACFIFVAAAKLGRQAFTSLIDAAPKGIDSAVSEAVNAFQTCLQSTAFAFVWPERFRSLILRSQSIALYRSSASPP
jgi:cation efflux family protein